MFLTILGILFLIVMMGFIAHLYIAGYGRFSQPERLATYGIAIALWPLFMYWPLLEKRTYRKGLRACHTWLVLGYAASCCFLLPSHPFVLALAWFAGVFIWFLGGTFVWVVVANLVRLYLAKHCERMDKSTRPM